jgi:membrane dipeptidase
MVKVNGGVVMVNFIPGYVAPTPASARDRVGIEAGISPDEPFWSATRREELERLRRDLDDEREIERRLQDWISRNPAPRGSVSQVADHIDHIRDVAGIDHVGIGSDFYDAGGPSMAEGLGDSPRAHGGAPRPRLHRRGSEKGQEKPAAGDAEAERASEELRKSPIRRSPTPGRFALKGAKFLQDLLTSPLVRSIISISFN